MLEHLLSMGTGGGGIPVNPNVDYYDTSEYITQDILPDLGPSTPYSEVGNVKFYGLVAGNGESLSTLLNYQPGITNPSRTNSGWIKIGIDDKLLYVAKRCFRVGLPANGIVPNRTISIDGLNFRVRTLDYDISDNVLDMGAGVNERPGLYNSEWNRIMYRISDYIDGTSKEGIEYGSLVMIPHEEVGIVPHLSDGGYNYIRRLNSNTRHGAFRYVLLGSSSGTLSAAIASNPNVIGWRPVLEYIKN